MIQDLWAKREKTILSHHKSYQHVNMNFFLFQETSYCDSSTDAFRAGAMPESLRVVVWILSRLFSSANSGGGISDTLSALSPELYVRSCCHKYRTLWYYDSEVPTRLLCCSLVISMVQWNDKSCHLKNCLLAQSAFIWLQSLSHACWAM